MLEEQYVGDIQRNKNGKPYNGGVGFKAGFLRQHSVLFVRLGSLLDSLVIFSALFWTLWLYGKDWQLQHLNAALFTALLFQIIATFFHLYRSWRVVRFRYEILNIFLCWSASIILLIFSLFVLKQQYYLDSTEAITWFISAFFVMCLVHFSTRMFTRYVRAFGYDVRRAAFVGANEIAVRMTKIYAEHQWMGMNVLGIFDDRHATGENRISVEDTELGGSIDDLIKLARNCDVDIVYVCLPLAAEKRIKELIDLFSDTTVSIYYCPNFFNFDLMQSSWDDVFGQPVISVVESPFVDHYRILKRLEDLTIVIAFLPLLIILIITISLAIMLTSKGPIFFKQKRYGINGESFKMWKFRTMYVESCKESFSQVTKDDPRITPFGAFLRKTSLDEIPQFFNVLLGDMSVVGPRPHPDSLNEELRKRIYRYMLRHKIKPGITGLAQVSGFRGETESIEKMAQRIEHDLQYIRQWSLILDLKILFRTIFCLSGSSVY